MKITGKTKITGLFGYPVDHSLSPIIHNTGFTELDINYCYLPFSVHPDMLGNAVSGIRAMNFTGVNVTVPHKENVMAFLDEINEEAEFIGAVNTVLNDGGRLIGYNTDGRGFMRSLEEEGVSPAGKDVFIAGAGGASRAISYYLAQSAKNLFLFDIDKPKLERLVGDLKKLNPNVIIAENSEEIKSKDIVINATPLGLKEQDPLPIDTALLSNSQVVYDLVYKNTKMLREADAKGCKTLHGLGMLFWQAVYAFEIWTKKEAPAAVMKTALVDAMQA